MSAVVIGGKKVLGSDVTASYPFGDIARGRGWRFSHAGVLEQPFAHLSLLHESPDEHWRVDAMRQLAGVVLLILAGCVSPESNITMYPVTSGGTLGQHLESRSSAVVLVLDPADLVVCGNHVSRWMEWGREHPGQLLIVLSKVPSQADRKQLLLFRVRHDAVLQGSRKFARITTPHEYLVENGQVVLSEPVPVGSPESPLLKALERGQVAGMAKSRRT